MRSQRVAEAMKTELAQLIRDEVKDPRIGFVSIVKVEVTGDLRQAKVYVSVLGDDAAKKNTLKGLQSAAGMLRREVAQRLQIRYTPELVFSLDESIAHGARIAALLNEVKRQEGGNPSGE